MKQDGTLKTWLTLARVSNLPTVWSNVLAAAVLAQWGTGQPQNLPLLALFGVLLALSLMYTGGMLLNDAFDASWDEQHHNPRPLAQHPTLQSSVWFYGFMSLLLGLVLLALLTPQRGPVVVGIVLAMAILVYNATHKSHPHSAFIMGFCRLCVYIIAALALAELNGWIALAALAMWLYIAGLTYVARHEYENRLARTWPLLLLAMPALVGCAFGYASSLFWVLCIGFIVWVASRIKRYLWTATPDVKAGVTGLLVAIPLIDALLLAGAQAVSASMFCLGVFLIMPRMQRWISGT